jgi:hypothetical protein
MSKSSPALRVAGRSPEQVGCRKPGIVTHLACHAARFLLTNGLKGSNKRQMINKSVI